MTKKDMVTRLYKASQLIKEVEDSLPNHPDIDAQYHITVSQARDICIDFSSYLAAILKMRARVENETGK